MFDRIIDVFLQFAGTFKVFTVVDAYEMGVVLRFGKFHRVIGPGWRFLWPWFERAVNDNVVPRTGNLTVQGLTTKDGKSITVGGIVTAQIVDIQKALLECENVSQVIMDACYGAIGDFVSSSTWEQLLDPNYTQAITKACHKQARKYGVEIMRVQLSDKALSRNIRLFQTTT